MTKAERHKWYKLSLEHVERCGYSGMCEKLWDYSVSNDVLRKTFIELYKKMPLGKGMNQYWFPISKYGQKKRIAILRQCIKETAPKKKQSK